MLNIPLDEWIKPIRELKKLQNIKLKNSIDVGDKTIIFSFTVINKRTAWTRGSTNKTQDGYFVSYFDYDLMKESYVVEQLKVLQEQFDLGDLLLFKSSEQSFQAVGFAKLTLHEFQEVLMRSSCDFAYINFPKYLPFAKDYVLRQFKKGKTPRPKYLYTLEKETNKNQSYAHWKYFNLLYPDAKINKLTNSDGLTKIKIVDYPTGTNI